MWVKINGKNSVEIDNEVVIRILNFYPEEELLKHKDIEEAFTTGSISISKLKKRSESIFIPWQMFFLNKKNLDKELEKIENIRKDKFPNNALLIKRKGQGDITSKRILDRLLRIQNFVSNVSNLPKNTFCGSLKNKNNVDSVNFIIKYFNIDINKLRNRTHAKDYLDDLIEGIQSKNINISKGVLTNGILLNHQVVKSNVYRNTSGFAIKDETIPFIFLPSEINPDEISYRQIYTLLYLLVAIGLEKYEYLVESKFSYKKIKQQDKNQKHVHNICSEFLLPESHTDLLKNQIIDQSVIDAIKIKYKLSPTAIITILKIRKIITPEKCEELKPPEFIPIKNTLNAPIRPAKIITSVTKFCGNVATPIINMAIKNKSLGSIPAQYLIFGRPQKKNYKLYFNQI